jgi:hypothetical protein
VNIQRAKFERFHENNPHIYVLFKRFAFEAINAGRKHFSARMILHRIRWYTMVETSDTEYKVNDHHSPYYGRLFMKEFPAHDGFFRTRFIVGEAA